MAKVTVNLERVTPSDSTFLPRELVLDSLHKNVLVGRSSKRTGHSERGVPQTNNAFFSSPVISRKHAEFFIEQSLNFVRIRDCGSLHGTHVNGQKLNPSSPANLTKGDIISIGSTVTSPDHHYTPMKFRVSYDWPNFHPLQASIVDLSSPISSPAVSQPASLVRPISLSPVSEQRIESPPLRYTVPDNESDARSFSGESSHYSDSESSDKEDGDEAESDKSCIESSASPSPSPPSSTPMCPGSSINHPLAIDEDLCSDTHNCNETAAVESAPTDSVTVEENPSSSGKAAQVEEDNGNKCDTDITSEVAKPAEIDLNEVQPSVVGDRQTAGIAQSPCVMPELSDLDDSDLDNIFTPESSPGPDTCTSPGSSGSKKGDTSRANAFDSNAQNDKIQVPSPEHENEKAPTPAQNKLDNSKYPPGPQRMIAIPPPSFPRHQSYVTPQIGPFGWSACHGMGSPISSPMDSPISPQYHPYYPVNGIPAGPRPYVSRVDYSSPKGLEKHLCPTTSDYLNRVQQRMDCGLGRVPSQNTTSPSNPSLSRMSIPNIISNPENASGSKRKADEISSQNDEKQQSQIKGPFESSMTAPKSPGVQRINNTNDDKVLVVMSLPNQIDRSFLEKEFGGFGKIVSCHIVPSPGRHLVNMAYIEFEAGIPEKICQEKRIPSPMSTVRNLPPHLAPVNAPAALPGCDQPTPSSGEKSLPAGKPKEQTTQTDEEPARKRVRLNAEPTPITAPVEKPNRLRARKFRLGGPSLKGLGMGIVVGGVGMLGALMTLPESLF